jgi:hypothetical protein
MPYGEEAWKAALVLIGPEESPVLPKDPSNAGVHLTRVAVKSPTRPMPRTSKLPTILSADSNVPL